MRALLLAEAPHSALLHLHTDQHTPRPPCADTSPGISDQSGSFDQQRFDYSDFQRKARNIVRSVLKSMKANYIWFDHPVEKNIVPDYYHVIKHPMDLGTVGKKLGAKSYSTPADFYAVRPAPLADAQSSSPGWPSLASEACTRPLQLLVRSLSAQLYSAVHSTPLGLQDVMLVWSNCALYNKPDSACGRVGIQSRIKFEELWAESGLESGLRHPRRSTAGTPDWPCPQAAVSSWLCSHSASDRALTTRPSQPALQGLHEAAALQAAFVISTQCAAVSKH